MANTNKWFARLTSGSQSWGQRDADLIVPPELGLTCSYEILLSVEQQVDVQYNVLADIGLISGQVVLPPYSAEADLAEDYQVLALTVTKDLVANFRVLNYVEKTNSFSYTIRSFAQNDRTVTYSSGGYVENDLQGLWAVVNGIEQDSIQVSYDITAIVISDTVCTYNVNTTPWTAAESVGVLYRVLNSVEREFEMRYRVFTGAELDLVLDYDIKQEAYRDIGVFFEVNSVAFADLPITYSVVGKTIATSDRVVVYNIVNQTRRVPNVIGHPLPKARQLITDADLRVGQITYQ